jgi:hypothetical protein
LCGLQAENGHMPVPETLGSVLNDAWEAEEQIRGSLDEGALSTLSLAFQVLLGEKQQLRMIRIPVWQFGSEAADKAEYADEELIDKYLTGAEGWEFIEETVNSIGLSLLYDDYSDDELKTLLTALGWFVIDDTRDLFLHTVLSKTRSDLVAAEEKIDKIMQEHGDDQRAEIYREAHSVLRQYPVYDQMLSDNLSDDIDLVMTAVMKGELKIEVPLYSVLGGMYAVISKLVENLKDISSSKPASDRFPSLEETLFMDGENHFFFPQLIEGLQRAVMETEDEQFRDALDGLLFFLVLLSDTRQINIIKLLYVNCIRSYFSNLPVELLEANVEFSTMSDYCDRGLIERYASHLETLEMMEEATHVRDVFNTMGEKAGRGFNVFNDDLVKMAKNVLTNGGEEV